MMINKICWGLLVLALIASFGFVYPVLAWLLLINILTFLIYGADKLAARKSWQRVPEKTLLAFGLAGGWPAAWLAQQAFRHKTQKQPFRRWFFGSVVLNLAAVAAALYLWRGGSW
ncbi:MULTISPECIES: DUF1294 domain-containing protein [Enterobacteriaceae]|uniref:DUF1294 domain-containing protein n=1 Tax=Enterobacteriaceae TaxID=543 RepID=UPI0015FF5BC5|nr:DUF1294 domain-containing protein [Klebsiella sp. WP8-S18-ESBL-06]